jgi:hypothetical protein
MHGRLPDLGSANSVTHPAQLTACTRWALPGWLASAGEEALTITRASTAQLRMNIDAFIL